MMGGEVMLAPVIAGLKSAGIMGAKMSIVGGMAYGGYKYWDNARYSTHRAMLLDRNWQELGLVKPLFSLGDAKRYRKPKYIKEEKVEDYLYKSYFKLPTGMAVKHVREKLDEIELFLNAEIDCYREGEHCVMEISTGHLFNEEAFDIRHVLNLTDCKLPICIGNSKRGFQVIDLAKHPHLLVGGQTGGGKSVFMRQALSGLMHYIPPQDLDVYMVDLKGGLEFQLFKESPHVKDVAKNVWDALDMLVRVEKEMDRRFEIFHEAGVENITEYHALGHELTYLLLVIDEFAELSPEDAGKKEVAIVPEQYRMLALSLQLFDPDKIKKGGPATAMLKEVLEKTHSIVFRLLRLARALGIHLMLATQRPDAKVLPGGSKANIPVTVCFKVRNKLNSQILLDSDSAAYLPPAIPGRAILQMGHLETEVQVPFLSSKKARELLEDMSDKLITYEPQQMSEIPIPNAFYEDDEFDPIQTDFLPIKEGTEFQHYTADELETQSV